MSETKSWRNQTDWEARSKRAGLKWLNADPIKHGSKADRKCQKCGAWLYAEGKGHVCG